MRLYGVIQAFRSGRMPDNNQIDETLKYFITHSPIDLDQLSPEGRKLVDDVRAILETVSGAFGSEVLLVPDLHNSLDSKFRKRMPTKFSNNSSITPLASNSAIVLPRTRKRLCPQMPPCPAKTMPTVMDSKPFNISELLLRSS